ncbi:MAG TPA: adenylate/guanylate cyclase domain-containing protein [Cellvibrionaceae bacterium]
MPTERQRQAIMFADVSGSSVLYKHLGNTLAKRSVDTTLDTLKEITQSHQGHVIKTLGDEIMARFEDSEQVYRAAIAMQQAINTSGEGRQIRIGIAYGETLMDSSGDVFGETVNDAAAVAHIARAGQIVVTKALTEQLGAHLQQLCQPFDKVVLKGSQISQTLYRVSWESNSQPLNATRVMSALDLDDYLTSHRLWLRTPSGERYLSPEQTPLVVGRDAAKVAVHIDNSRASREHCDIIYRRGKYVLVDHSTNGTYIQALGAIDALYIRREETPLVGEGQIGIGQAPGKKNPFTLFFRVAELAEDAS